MASSVFETLLVVDGQPVEAEAHLQRLKNASGIDAADFLRKTAAELPGYQRLRIDFRPPRSLTASHQTIVMPTLFEAKFTHLKLVSKQLKDRRLNAGHGQHKIANRRELESLEAETAPAIPLLVDGSNNILETTRHSIFIIEGQTLLTPALDGRILPGVTRQAVIEEAQKLGLICREESLSLDRAVHSDGMFVTNSTTGIGWVDQCNAVHWPDIPPIVRSLHKALAARWRLGA